jgi:hypothetical protein
VRKLAEIVCRRCQNLTKVPADTEEQIECPCEERWVIDVSRALGERAQAHIAGRFMASGALFDCPGCGAGGSRRPRIVTYLRVGTS